MNLAERMQHVQSQQFEEMTHDCQVCGDVAAGYHFGAFTCEGCKSFFGRTCKPMKKRQGTAGRMRSTTPDGPPEPKLRIADCKIGGRCTVQGRSRTGCKRCRWEKCLQANMSRGNSRYGRRSNYFKVTCMIEQKEKSRAESRTVTSFPRNAVQEPSFIDSPVPDHLAAALTSSRVMEELLDDRQTTTVPLCKPVATLPMFHQPSWPSFALYGQKASPTPPYLGVWPTFDQICWSFSPQLRAAKESLEQTEPLDLSTKRRPARSRIYLEKREKASNMERDGECRAERRPAVVQV